MMTPARAAAVCSAPQIAVVGAAILRARLADGETWSAGITSLLALAMAALVVASVEWRGVAIGSDQGRRHGAAEPEKARRDLHGFAWATGLTGTAQSRLACGARGR